MKKLSFLAALAVTGVIAASLGIYAMADDYGIMVRLNAVTDSESEIIDFGEYSPIQINSHTYVPLRAFAENMGMKVGWDQSNSTAFIKLMADSDSDKPIERYAAEHFKRLEDRAPGEKSNITISLMTDNSLALLRYNYDIGNGNVAGLGAELEMNGAAELIEDRALMIPLRDIAEFLGLEVSWNQEEMTVDISIPEECRVKDGLYSTDQWIPTRYYAAYEPPGYIPDGVHEIGEYLGNFKITRYCPCSICNGGWGSNTAWAGEIAPGRTVSINLNDGIPKLAWVYIDGIGWRRAEDTGGGVARHQLDVAVSTHSEAVGSGVSYRDVWLAK